VPVYAIELRNARDTNVRILSIGATIQALCLRNSDGTLTDIVLGHRTVAEYERSRQYLGATVGRYANRIAKGTFLIDGTRVILDANDGVNHLHGGKHGFDLANWKIELADKQRAILSHTSAHDEGRYPGRLEVAALFQLNDDNELTIEYRARSDRDTIANITHHGYFNLAGEDSGRDVLDHRLQLNAQSFTPVDETLIPTGEVTQVEGTAFDFRRATAIGSGIKNTDEQIQCAGGYDHNYVLSDQERPMRFAALLQDPLSGRSLELHTSAPGLQFYSGNFLDGTTRGKHGTPYQKHFGLCLEPQLFPDSPNQPSFPSARLSPGHPFLNRIFLKLNAA
jgi:aldose 1-epimerase